MFCITGTYQLINTVWSVGSILHAFVPSPSQTGSVSFFSAPRFCPVPRVVDSRTARTLIVITAPVTCSTSGKTFKFSSLPTELRLMVWKETFEPRILHITSEMISSQLTFPPGQGGCVNLPHAHLRLKSREPPPIALQICREFRALALKHYTLSFHSSTSPSPHVSE